MQMAKSIIQVTTSLSSIVAIYCIFLSSNGTYGTIAGPGISTWNVRGGSMLMQEAPVDAKIPVEARGTKHSDGEGYSYQTCDVSPEVIPTTPGPTIHGHNTKTSKPRSQRTPSISLADMAHALDWTADLNLRLKQGITELQTDFLQTALHSTQDTLRGGGRIMKSQPYRIPFVSMSPKSERTKTIFHQSSACSLESHIERVSKLLEEDLDEDADIDLERFLTMIYLDRATSTETARSEAAKIPFVEPSTVHRIVLSAMLLAASAVRDTNCTQLYDRVRDVLGISNVKEMVEWMEAALGECSVFVTPTELHEYKLVWEGRFGTQQSKD